MGTVDALLLGYGGYQEARGGGFTKNNHFFVENVYEELDAEGEWYYDDQGYYDHENGLRGGGSTRMLYYFPPAGAAGEGGADAGAADGGGGDDDGGGSGGGGGGGGGGSTAASHTATSGHTTAAAPEWQSDVVMPLLDSLVRISNSDTIPTSLAAGSKEAAVGISFSGLEFTETRATFMAVYDVPSGGDWAVHRNGALYVESAERVVVEDCFFNQVGGNGIVFNGHVTDSIVRRNEFGFSGDSAIVSVGNSHALDGSAPTYPNRNTFEFNHIHHVGVYGKQTSCYFQALSANSSFVDNVCYQGPRAGLNYNDGFGGNYTMARNLIFSMVLETRDHGPVNTWDRQPFLTRNGVDDGFAPSAKLGLQGVSIVKARSYFSQNFIIASGGSSYTIDHDDGSQYYTDSSNFMIYGGCKNWRGHSKSCEHNTIVFPGLMASAGPTCQMSGGFRCDPLVNKSCVRGNLFADQFFEGNDCIVPGSSPYSIKHPCYATRANLSHTVFHTRANTLYTR
jgi:hypothetical protein